jgi:hypothetical protein
MGHMSLIENAVALVGDVLILVAVLGILARRRYRICYTFLLYLSAVLVSDVLLTFVLYTKLFWLLKEVLINALRFGVALELSLLTFRAFPGARSTARGIVLLLLVVTLVTVVAVSGDGNHSVGMAPPTVELIAGKIQPRLLNGTIWLFTAIAAVILWYRLPVDPFHKAILIGFVPFLLIFTSGLNILDSYGWDQRLRTYVNYAQTVAYSILAGYWARAAWMPAGAPIQAPEGVPALQHQASWEG